MKTQKLGEEGGGIGSARSPGRDDSQAAAGVADNCAPRALSGCLRALLPRETQLQIERASESAAAVDAAGMKAAAAAAGTRAARDLRGAALADRQMRLSEPFAHLPQRSTRETRSKIRPRTHLAGHLLRGVQHVQQPFAAFVAATRMRIKHKPGGEIRGGYVASRSSSLP